MGRNRLSVVAIKLAMLKCLIKQSSDWFLFQGDQRIIDGVAAFKVSEPQLESISKQYFPRYILILKYLYLYLCCLLSVLSVFVVLRKYW